VVYVDLTGPSLSYQYEGQKFTKGDSTYINNQTKIKISATDEEAGLQSVAYSLDGNQAELPYKEPFTVPADGFHKVTCIGYDNVNNRNIKPFDFIVDNRGPDIFHHFSISPIQKSENLDVYPSYVTIFLASTDQSTGSEAIKYTINDGKEIVYIDKIGGFAKDKVYKITVKSADKLGNATVKEIKFKTGKY